MLKRKVLAICLIITYTKTSKRGAHYGTDYFSNELKGRLNALELKGYCAETGNIRHIVLWKGENEAEEIPIVLPNIILTK